MQNLKFNTWEGQYYLAPGAFTALIICSVVFELSQKNIDPPAIAESTVAEEAEVLVTAVERTTINVGHLIRAVQGFPVEFITAGFMGLLVNLVSTELLKYVDRDRNTQARNVTTVSSCLLLGSSSCVCAILQID